MTLMLSTAHFFSHLEGALYRTCHCMWLLRIKAFPVRYFGKQEHKKTKRDLTSKMVCYQLVALCLKQLHSNVVQRHLNTHTHTHIYIYIYVCVCVCVCVHGQIYHNNNNDNNNVYWLQVGRHPVAVVI